MSVSRFVVTHSFNSFAASTVIMNSDGTQNVADFPANRFQGSTPYRFRIAVDAKSLWVKLFKGAPVAATKGTAGEILVPAGKTFWFQLTNDYDGFSVIEDAASAKGSISIVD